MQQYVNSSVWVKDRSRPLLTWLTVAAVALAIALIAWFILSRRATNAADSLAEAFRYHEAVVQNPIPPNITGYAFTTEDEKNRRAYEAFEKAARDYPSYNGEIGRYYAAIHQLRFEPEKAEATLKELSQKDSETGATARFALAERYEATGKYDLAISEYQKLKSKPYNIPTVLLDFETARTYEAQGKTKEAVDLYFAVANNKDWRSTMLGNKAVSRLSVLAPEKVDQLPPAEPDNPFGNPLGGFGGFQ